MGANFITESTAYERFHNQVYLQIEYNKNSVFSNYQIIGNTEKMNIPFFIVYFKLANLTSYRFAHSKVFIRNMFTIAIITKIINVTFCIIKYS